MLDLNTLNSLRADIASIKDDADAAVSAIRASIRLERTIPVLFYRQFVSRRILESLRLLLRSTAPTDAQLAALQQCFEELPDDDGMAAELLATRAQTLGEFWPYPAGAGSWALRGQIRARGIVESVMFVAVRPWVTHQMRVMLQPFDQAIEIARKPWPQKLDATEAFARTHSLPDRSAKSGLSFAVRLGLFLPDLAVWNLHSHLPWAGAILVQRRVPIGVLAVERFRRAHAGTPPASLAELVPEYMSAIPVDPFAGQPLRYVVTEDSYIVYSVDVDRVDDKGALYGAYSGGRTRIMPNDKSPRDLGMRVPLTPVR